VEPAETVPVPEKVVLDSKTNMSYRIAIASSDGQSVNQHFGQAENFLIYEVSEGNIEFIEDREVTAEPNNYDHSDVRIDHILNLISDCKIVFALRIGEQVVRKLNARDIKTFPVNFSLNHIFTTLLKRQTGRVKVV
jgi:nitrogen fixation protein NifX